MATYRIGIGSLNLKDGAVGIGTESTGLGNLKVEGTYKVTDLDVTVYLHLQDMLDLLLII